MLYFRTLRHARLLFSWLICTVLKIVICAVEWPCEFTSMPFVPFALGRPVLPSLNFLISQSVSHTNVFAQLQNSRVQGQIQDHPASWIPGQSCNLWTNSASVNSLPHLSISHSYWTPTLWTLHTLESGQIWCKQIPQYLAINLRFMVLITVISIPLPPRSPSHTHSPVLSTLYLFFSYMITLPGHVALHYGLVCDSGVYMPAAGAAWLSSGGVFTELLSDRLIGQPLISFLR